jgi:hypothetical protein
MSRWPGHTGTRQSRPAARRRCLPRVEELESRLAPSNLPLTADPGVQQMPSVAVDPHDPNHLVVVYMDYSLRATGYAGVGVRVSRDGGATWQHSFAGHELQVPLPAGFDEGAGQPIVQFAPFDKQYPQGRVYVTYMASTFLGPHQPGITNPSSFNPALGVRERTLGFQSNNGIFVARSDDGGLTWDTPVAVAENLYDGTHKVPYEIMPALAVDTFATLPDGRPNPNYGTLYDVWARYYPAGQFPGEPTSQGGSQMFIAVSHDAGQSWQVQLKQPPGAAPTTVIDTDPNTGIGAQEGTGFAFWSKVTVGPQGDVYVADSDGGYFGVYHSTDGGKSFTAPDPVTLAGYPFGDTNNTLPGGTLNNSGFRTIGVRDIVADPTRPGALYIADELAISDSAGNPLDEGDVIFARSTDSGATWQSTFQVGTHAGANVLNDDNDGSRASGSPGDVADGQALPQLAIDAHGDVTVIWYDTRRDPADTRLDVYGTVSTDGGKTFSPNFPVTDQSFDPNAGRFTDAEGLTDFYMGDALGLALVNGTAYAAWTDTRGGNQDVFFSSYSVTRPPPPPSNRFAPNATAATATDLGKVVTRSLPKLTVAAGGEEWFRLQAAATGTLTVTASLALPGDAVRLELYKDDGTTRLADGIALPNSGGQVITLPAQSGQTYLVRVLPGPGAAAGTPAVYTLDVRSLTADLGTQVYGTQGGTLAAGQDVYYALTVPAAGSLVATLTPGAGAVGNFHLEVIDPATLTVLASGQAAGAGRLASLAVKGGQAVYLHVSGDAAARGDFTLTFTNLDQFTTPGATAFNFPVGGGPSQAVLADLRHNGLLDVVVSHIGENVVSVLLNNGDGTFQAPRDYAVGAFTVGGPATLTGLNDYRRDLAVADLNGDGAPDLVVVNHDSGDLSILFGRGDGTFAPEQRVAATTAPFALAVGDVNGDRAPDLVVLDSTGGPVRGVVLPGRGDGTFAPPIPLALPPDTDFAVGTLRLADANGDGKPDILFSDNKSGTVLLSGHGDGTFGPPVVVQPRTGGPALAVADLNGDGKPDLVSTAFNFDDLSYSLGNGDGTFQPAQDQAQIEGVEVGRAPVAVAVADLGSALPDGSPGPPDGLPDLILADAGLTNPTFSGPPEVVLLPGQADGHGQFAGFGSPIPLAFVPGPLDVKVGDLDGNGGTDLVVVDSNGVEVIYGKPPALPATARNLGTVVHALEPARTIVPGHEDANYQLTAPTEAARGAGDEVLDFSGFFQATAGPGIGMEVTDTRGAVLGSGERFQVIARQGEALTLHVFGLAGAPGQRGSGAYTLDIDALPHVVSVEAQALLPGAGAAPGGPTTSLVITLQGDRLDPAAAEVAAHYRVTWAGPDGTAGTADDQAARIQGAVYDPGSNVDVASGAVYPTAVRQTVTLLFAAPLSAGSYRVELTPAVRTAPFNDREQDQISASATLTGHPVVAQAGGGAAQDVRRTEADLVSRAGALGDLAVWQGGTPFLTQLHDDLGAVLDARLTELGDASIISAAIDGQIVSRVGPAVGAPDDRPVGVLVIWLDPVIVAMDGGSRGRVSYNPQTNSYQNTFARAFASVTGSVELLILPFVPTEVQNVILNVQATPAARGGVAIFSPEGNEVESLTAALRAGTSQFVLSFGEAPAVAAAPGQAAAPHDPPADARRAAEVMVALNSTRSDLAGVRPTTPFPGPPATGAPNLPAVTVAALANAGAPQNLVGGHGKSDDSPAPRGGFVRGLLIVIEEVTRQFPALGRSLRGLLRSLGIRFAAAALDPPPQPPTGGPPAAAAGAGGEGGPSPPAGDEPAPVVAEVAPSRAPALLAVALGLAAGYFARRNKRRRPAAGREERPAARDVRPRKPGHVA